VRDGRGVATADFDNDGRLDFFVANANGEPFLYHNVLSPVGHWAEFILAGAKSNRGGVGAQGRATAGGRTVRRFVDGGNGFASQGSSRVHVGLAQATTIDTLEIRWPSGARQTFQHLPADRIVKITEGGAAPGPFSTNGRTR